MFVMPKYKSHKEIHAAEIHMISIGPNETILTFDDCEPIHFINTEYTKMITRYSPKRGDFLIVYEDGYKSFSPREAFLGGYTKI